MQDMLQHCSYQPDHAASTAAPYCSDSRSCVSDNDSCDTVNNAVMCLKGCENEGNKMRAIVDEDEDNFSLLHVKDVPDHHKEISILTGYRQRMNYLDCFRSIFKLHNETVNIWTHLLGFFFFFILMVKDCVWSQEHIRDKTDYSATVLQLITYQACMLSSSLFHTMSCHDTRTSWQRLDQSSILLALYGTYVRIIINNFQCFPVYRGLHLGLVTIMFGTVLFMKSRSGPDQKARVSLPLFLCLALYSVAPFAHWVSLSHMVLNTNITNTMLWWMLFPYIVAGVGVLFYVTHFPEIKVPTGVFDIFGHSHQIWHVFIFSGMASWYWLSCWVSLTRPETCLLSVEAMTNSGIAANISDQVLNSSFVQYWL